MSAFDKAKDEAQEKLGQGKQKVGEATDNKDLENEGRRDEAEGAVKGAGERLKEGFSDAKDKLK